MSEYTEILLSNDDSKKIEAATTIVNICDSRLTVDQIINAHNRIYAHSRSYDNRINKVPQHFYRQIFLLSTLLKINVNMYIAIMKAINEAGFHINLRIFLQTYKYDIYGIPHKVGFNTGYGKEYCIEAYKILLAFCNFDVNCLDMPNDVKQRVEEYRLKLYPPCLTKRAIK